ncbi:NUDIX domain-containing protein [Chitinophaga sp. 30R24]|uniref:NUDIX domain-containing protein n=1 Tax=Chitinophaga sp. 30R24 TaxID=3248838 RepID=UPI003B8FA6FF
MKISAGILLVDMAGPEITFLLAHPGGPFFKNKNAGWWTVPKGELLPSEEPLAAALREFEEETGHVPQGPFLPLSPIIQKGGKQVHCWAAQGTLDPTTIVSNTFETEWPPYSGQMKTFPEIDKAGWFTYQDAKVLINEKQASFLDEALLLFK